MIETSESNGVVIALIKDSNRINAASADTVKTELTAIVSKQNAKVVLDLSNINFIDSTGIGVLISALKTSRQNSGDFSLCNLKSDVLGLLKLMKLDKVFEIIE